MPDQVLDYFDRLLARHMTSADRPVTRVRPRLPGPFERIESLHREPDAPEAPDAPDSPPAAPEPPARAPFAPLPPRREHRVLTERHTIIREEQLTAHDGDRTPRLLPGPRPDRPVTHEHRHLLRPAVTGPVRAIVRETTPGAAPRDPEPAAPRTGVLISPRIVVPPRPPEHRASVAPAARRTVRPAEPTVHVKIGRLEVRAAGTEPPARRPTPSRRAPAVNLTDYLSKSDAR